ncbi:hypothetical protein J6590_010763 [Homalodisca vitripennis]|nr:hypothetical protein J6590_010763 [Homalodisca vitripennis]
MEASNTFPNCKRVDSEKLSHRRSVPSRERVTHSKSPISNYDGNEEHAKRNETLNEMENITRIPYFNVHLYILSVLSRPLVDFDSTMLLFSHKTVPIAYRD